jgi:hypothetical protein
MCGLRADFYYCHTVAVIDVGDSLCLQDGSVVYNCCWSSPAQSLLGPSSVELATIFYCLRLESSLFVASYDSQGYCGGIRTRLHTGIESVSYVTTELHRKSVFSYRVLLCYLATRCSIVHREYSS